MGTRLVGYQPQYFPRLHYFARILNSDVFTISDYLQYVRKHAFPNPDGTTRRDISHQAHTPIKTGQGVLLLDVPVKKGGIAGRQALNEAVIDYTSAWQSQTVNVLQYSYQTAPQFEKVFPSLSLVLTQRYDSLAEFTIESTVWALGILLELPWARPEGPRFSKIHDALSQSPFRLRRIVRMSETPVPPADKKERDANDWLIETCKHFGADEYYFGGTSASAYMDFPRFENEGITLVQQNWKGGPYRQQFPKIGFVPNLSIIDLLMNVPPAEARAILSS
jgi:hypothetical protein